MTRNNTFGGSCHCGAIGFEFSTDIPPARWPVRACQCRFCRAHDALSASTPDADIRFTATNSDMLQKYRFGLHTADFLLCRNCGVYIGAVIDIGSAHYGIINTHALSPVPDDIATPEPISYDGEKTDNRVSRRQERWAKVSALP